MPRWVDESPRFKLPGGRFETGGFVPHGREIITYNIIKLNAFMLSSPSYLSLFNVFIRSCFTIHLWYGEILIGYRIVDDCEIYNIFVKSNIMNDYLIRIHQIHMVEYSLRIVAMVPQVELLKKHVDIMNSINLQSCGRT